MVQPRVFMLRAPGTNCDSETAWAFELAAGRVESGHVNQLLETPGRLREFQILCIPGGFSYGDDIAAGRILGIQIRYHLAECMRQFHRDGKLILGICNGFQILMHSGLLLPIDPERGARATLASNASGRFEDRWVTLVTAGSSSVFFRGIERLYLPVAHAEGKFVVRDREVLDELQRNRQIALRYAGLRDGTCGRAHEVPDRAAPDGIVPYPENPNGSVADIAGICDPTGRICGLMPHPERHIDPTHHPRWTRGEGRAVGDGLRVFQNAVSYFS